MVFKGGLLLGLSMVLVLFMTTGCAGRKVVWEPQSSAPLLRSETFDSDIGNDRWLIFFYADWCGVCLNFKPNFDQLGGDVAAAKIGWKLGRVDVDKDFPLAIRFQVHNVPALFAIVDRVVYPYNETMLTLSGLLEFMHGKYKNVEPWTGWSSPMSEIPMSISFLALIISEIVDAAEFIHSEYDVPAWVISLVTFVFLLFTSLSFALFIRIFLNFCCPGRPQPTVSTTKVSSDKASAQQSETKKNK